MFNSLTTLISNIDLQLMFLIPQLRIVDFQQKLEDYF